MYSLTATRVAGVVSQATVDDAEGGFADESASSYSRSRVPRGSVSGGGRVGSGVMASMGWRGDCWFAIAPACGFMPPVRPAHAGASASRAGRDCRAGIRPRPSTARGRDNKVTPSRAGGRPGVAPAAKAVAFHGEHGLVVLVEHLPAALTRPTPGRLARAATRGPRCDMPGVAGIDRRRPAQLLEPGRTEARRLEQVGVAHHPHRDRGGVPAARGEPAEQRLGGRGSSR